MKWIKELIRFIIFPLSFYFLFFCILTYPAILSFSNSLFADSFDGLQNVWNIWWVNKAITQFHKSIWFTQMLHFPFGTSLIGHTLNPLNGIIGILLLKFIPLVQTFNFILILSFVTSGFFAFLLAFYMTGSYKGSLISGFIYTFSNYHFAHAQGHLQTVSMQWIPLFLLFWIKFLDKPKVLYALGSAVFLYFNILSDYYYFFYCVIAGFIIYIYKAIYFKDLLLKFGKKFIGLMAIFIAVSLVSSGQIVLALVKQNFSDPLLGSHPPAMFSADFLSIFIPGGHWKFADLTYSFWSKLPGNIHESSVSIGISVLVMLIYVWLVRRRIKNGFLNIWYLILVFFTTLSFGPQFQVLGSKIAFLPMPYALLERIFPFLTLSGMPVRMMVMVILSASIIFAYGYRKLAGVSFKNNLILSILLLTLFFEYLPQTIPQTKLIVPTYISKLKNLPLGGVLDLTASAPYSLFYQTVHEKPQAFGYIARVPQSVMLNDFSTNQLIYAGQFSTLCRDLGFRYLISPSQIPSLKNEQIIDQYKEVVLYDLGKDNGCQINKL